MPKRKRAVEDWVAARDIAIGDKVHWMFEDNDLPIVNDLEAREAAAAALKTGARSAVAAAGTEAAKETVKAIISRGSLHPADIASAGLQGCVAGCCGACVKNCIPEKTKYLGEVIGYADDNDIVIVRFRGRGVWRLPKPTLLEIQKGVGHVVNYGAGAWRAAWDEERGYESLSRLGRAAAEPERAASG